MKRTLLRLFYVLAAALLLEVSLFNVNYYTHIASQPISVSLEQAKLTGLLRLDNGSLKVMNPDAAALTVTNLDAHIDSLQIRLTRANADGAAYEQTAFSLWATDEANEISFDLGSRQSVPGVVQTEYVTVHLAGKSTELSLRPAALTGDRLRVEAFLLNPRFPFVFLPARVLLCALSLWLLYILIPRHGYYRTPCRFACGKQRAVILVVILFQIAFFTLCAFVNPFYTNPPWYHHTQYHRMAVALSQGDLHLSDKPSMSLKMMENPYDTHLREATGTKYLHDTAYYNGYYFCYYGVVPVLMFHLPYYLLTGQAFPNHVGVYIASILFTLLSFWLTALLVKRFSWEKIPFLAYLILSLLLCGCCTYLVYYPSQYTLPVILGLVFILFGLCLWLRAERDDGLRMGCLALGSLSMALVAGCRPQLLLCSLLAVPIFWDSVGKRRLLFSRHTMGRTVAVLLPYAIVGVCLMAYNYLRFGSPFDFGANYNLTSNDMIRRGFVFARIPTALFLFLFQPPFLKPIFPYLSEVSQSTHYLGKTISESMFGGVLMTNVISLGSLFVFKARRLFEKRRSLWWLAVACLLLGVVIASFDAQAAGVLERYQAEFNWLLVLASMLVLLAALSEETVSAPERRLLFHGLSAAFVIGMLYFLLTPFLERNGSAGADIIHSFPSFYYGVYYGVQFWL